MDDGVYNGVKVVAGVFGEKVEMIAQEMAVYDEAAALRGDRPEIGQILSRQDPHRLDDLL